MKCLHCAQEFPDTAIADWSAAADPKRSLIKCPHCEASHLRELVDQTNQGLPVYSFRLWGHPATTRRLQKPVNGGRAAATSV